GKTPPSRPFRWANRAAQPRLIQSVHERYVNHFQYKNGILSAEDVPLTELADAVGTPFYCYATATLTRHYKVFAAALPKGSLVAFSVKANGTLAVLKTLGKLGAGADVVSGGELKKALAAGIPANRIVFSGVGKTREEMRLALEAGIYQFKVESQPERDALVQVAGALYTRASARPSPCASIRTSMRRRMPRLRRARSRRSLAFLGREPAASMLMPPSFAASRSSASTFTSAVRSPSSSLSSPRSSESPTSLPS